MKCSGIVKDGIVILDADAGIENGTMVEVTTRDESTPSLAEILAPFIGKVDGLPADLSINHDHYLYGQPKQTAE